MKNISRQEYDRLPLAERMGNLLLWGTPLLERMEQDRFVKLYSFGNFWAETCYDLQSQTLRCICTFTDPARLDAYLNAVELSLGVS